jgi:hypothetical protein
LTQGVEYNLTWPASQAPTNDVTISLFLDTDCPIAGSDATPSATFSPMRPKTAGFEAFAPFTVPALAAVSQGFFLRVQDSVSSQRNYSEYFTVQPLQLNGAGGCVINSMLPATQPYMRPAARCSPEYKWNISGMPTGICEVQPTGCRYYR